MLEIVGESIDIGPVPFSIYSLDKGGMPILFCKAGYEITPQRQEVLREQNRRFFVQREDMSTYVEYAAVHISDIVRNPQINPAEKLDLVKDVGSRMVRRIISDPAGTDERNAREFVSGYVDLILQSPAVKSSLFAVAQRGKYLLSRSFNVCTLCLLIGEVLYQGNRMHLSALGTGGLLLDIGMTTIPEEIIEKRDSLTEEEYKTAKTHVISGVDMLQGNNFHPNVIRMIEQHHERIDGSGYPQGLRGDHIHMYAQIAAVADTYDAITSERPYGPPKSHIEALTEMVGQIEKFNLKAFDILLRVVLMNDRLVEHFRKEHSLN
jgi:putative nucleotidyltransferase with HDIG domain